MEKLTSLSDGARVGFFGLGLAVAFAAAFLLGSAFDPAETGAGGSHQEGGGHSAAHERSEETEMTAHREHQATETAPGGLAVATGGYALRVASTHLEPGEPGKLRFQIEGPDGEAVREFDRLHEREMHLIVVRRDGAHFQHLHPELDPGGTWTAALTLPAAGVYRAFADFAVDGDDQTLAADLFASGRFEAQPFPASAAVVETDGYELRLEGAPPLAGQPAELRFSVSRDGREVSDLQDYLGAKGHLVALREGDLAFLHVHPDAQEEPGVIPFTAHFPTPGRYRLYLQFQHDGEVRTAEYTLAVRR